VVGKLGRGSQGGEAVEKFSKVGTEARPMSTEELKSLIAADVKIPDCAIEEAWQPDV